MEDRKMTTTARQLIVNAIENGTVLDHIPSENLFKVVDILNLAESHNQITIGSNLESKRSRTAISKMTS